MTRVSVIIPTRDRRETLLQTLQTLARQSSSAAALEVVVVDDGSRDGTAEGLDARRYPFRLVCERLERRESFCPARPRNRGLHAACGDIALFLDADILACPDLIAGHLEAHARDTRPRAVIGYTYGYPMRPEDRTPEALNPPPAERLLEALPQLAAADERWRDGREPIYAETRDLADHPAPWEMFWTNNVSVPRSLALEIGGFDEEFVGWGMEDLEFAYRLSERETPFTLARAARGVHYPHALADLPRRRREQEANRRRFIARHPMQRVELPLWDSRRAIEFGRELTALVSHPPCIPAEGMRAAARLVDRLCDRGRAAGRLMLCGWLPRDLALRCQPAAWCQPFPCRSIDADAAPATHHSPTAVLPLLGLTTPWEDGEFATAILADYWRWVPAEVYKGLMRESLRVAQRVVLLDTGAQPAVGPRTSARDAADCVAVLRDQWPGHIIDLQKTKGVRAVVVTPCSGGQDANPRPAA